jgi:hypothetical protein
MGIMFTPEDENHRLPTMEMRQPLNSVSWFRPRSIHGHMEHAFLILLLALSASA